MITSTTLHRLLGSAKEFAVRYILQHETAKENIKEILEEFVGTLERSVTEIQSTEQHTKLQILQLFSLYFQNIQSGSGIESLDHLKQHFKKADLSSDLVDSVRVRLDAALLIFQGHLGIKI